MAATFHLSAQERKASRSCEFRTTKATQRKPVSKNKKEAKEDI